MDKSRQRNKSDSLLLQTIVRITTTINATKFVCVKWKYGTRKTFKNHEDQFLTFVVFKSVIRKYLLLCLVTLSGDEILTRRRKQNNEFTHKTRHEFWTHVS